MNKASLTTGPVGKTILGQMLPMMVGMIGMVIFNLIDTFFIGKLGTKALAAMSFTLPVVMVQGAIAMGLGVGASAVISRAIGEGNWEKVQRLTTDSLFLSFTLVLGAVLLGLATMRPLFTLLGAEGEILEMVISYMRIWYPGVACVVIPMVGNNAIRAAGNTTIPSIIMLVAIVVNVILDPLLIYGIGPFPRWELAGAATATVFARTTTLITSLLILHFRFDMLTTRKASNKEILVSWKSILFVGIPAALTQLLIPISMSFITRLVALFGPAAVAALGISNRIEMFALSPLMALGAVLVPFIGQNSGANLTDRVRSGVLYSFQFSLILGITFFIIFIFTNKWLASFFDTNTDVIEIAGQYLIITSFSYGLFGITALTAQVFNALGKPFKAFSLTFIRLIILYLPLAFLGAHLYQIPGIFTGIAITNIISGIIASLWIHNKLKQQLISY